MIPSNIQDIFFSLPAPNAQKFWVQEFNSMARHTQEKNLDELIKKRRPNEPQDIQKYRKDNLRAITTHAITRAINNLQRIFSHARAVVVPNEDSKEYLSKPVFENYDFETYINQIVVPRMIEDPNGILVWWPTGEGVVDPTTKVDPQPILILSENIHYWDSSFIAFLAPEKSLVTVNDKGNTELDGDVYYIIDETGFYKYYQVGKKGENKYQLLKVYNQDMTKLPVIVLGGENKCKVDMLKPVKYFTSYFAGFVPFADEAISQFSDHQGVMVTASFPIKEVDGHECTECHGTGVVKDDDGDKNKCSHCDGAGARTGVSPYGVFIRRKSANPLDGNDVMEAVKYVSPDVSIIEYGGKYWQQLLQWGEKSLNLDYIDEAQSGEAKKVDREYMIAMLDRIGTNVYKNVIQNSILQIQGLLNRGDQGTVEVVLPNSFQPRTEAELTQEVTQLIKDGAPYPLIAETYLELVRKRWNGDPATIKLMEFMVMYDPYFVYPAELRSTLAAQGQILNTDVKRSLLGYNAALKLSKDVGVEKFLEMTFQEIETAVEKAIQAKLVETTTL